MRVLVACEYSGRVRDAFTARGHYAVSADLLPSDTEGNHYQGDVRDLMYGRWDLMIAFPPCTKLSKVGAAYWPRWREDGSQDEAIEFWLELWYAPIPRIAIENPAGIMSTLLRKPDQYVQPWWFGHPWKKLTGLWLKELPKLTPTNVVEPQGYWVDGGSLRGNGRSGAQEGAYATTEARSNAERAHERSKTFQGLANAMAEQWG